LIRVEHLIDWKFGAAGYIQHFLTIEQTQRYKFSLRMLPYFANGLENRY